MDLKEVVRVGVRVASSRWFVVFVCFLIMSCSGATYIFGIYSDAIKSSLGYDQQTLNTLGFFKDLGANVGIVSGLINEVTPPWVVLGVGAAMNLAGYLMIWLAVTRRIARPKVWQMNLYMCIGSNSQTFANTGALVTCVKNFPESRGVVLGLLKGFVGVSGAILTQLYHAFYGDDSSSLILLVGWLPSVVALVFMCVVRPMGISPEKNELRRFYSFLYIALALAGFLMIAIVIENRIRFSTSSYRAVAGIIIVFLLLPLVVVVKAELDNIKSARLAENPSCEAGAKPVAVEVIDSANLIDAETNSNGSEIDPRPIQNTEQEQFKDRSNGSDARQNESTWQKDATDAAEQQDSEKSFKPMPNPTRSVSTVPNDQSSKRRSIRSRMIKFFKGPKRGDDFTIPQALVSLDMLILFVATTCGVGATLTAIDNMGQIGKALGFNHVSITTFVSLISIWNFLGRVMAGLVSEIILQKYSIPRPLMLSAVLAIACVGHLFIAFALPGSLYVASIMIGLCFGAQWPVVFAVISELFGLKYYSTLYNFGAAASPLGTYLLSVKVAGYLYDKEARKQYSLPTTVFGAAPSPSENKLTCIGVECFRLTFIIMMLVTLFGSLVSGILVVRTREFYRGDIYAKFREVEKPPQKAEAASGFIKKAQDQDQDRLPHIEIDTINTPRL